MTVPFHKPVVCPILIGRESALTALHQLIEQAKDARGQVALICGEAGIGKSRLVAEVKGHAARLGLTTLQGDCFESDRSLSYAPFLDLFQTLFMTHSPETIAQYLGSTAPELSRVLPELGTLLPGLAAAPSLEPEQAQRRLFRAFARCFMRIAG